MTSARLTAPVALIDIDLSEEHGEIALAQPAGGGRYRSVLALVRRDGCPVGAVALPRIDGAITIAEIEAALTPIAVSTHRQPTATKLPAVSVVITTCAMPERAADCAAAILAGRTAPLEVIVVENRPGRRPTAELIAERFACDPRVRTIEQPVRGLSNARNAGLSAARGEIVAFTDDDVRVDAGWLSSIARVFATEPEIGCVTGPIVPLALDSPEQLVFEQFGRLGKGWEPRTYRIDDPPPGDPLFPFAAGQFGSGANIAIRADLARNLQGFDPLLGAGTRARGGEDLDLFIRVLHAGAAIRYEPGVLIAHGHPDSYESLRHHAFDYGVGLTAAIAKQAVAGRDRTGLLRRIPAGVRYALDPGSVKNAAKGPEYPRSLKYRELLGMAFGPFGYAAARRAARHAR